MTDLRAELAEARAEIERLHAELDSTNKGILAVYAELDEKAENLRRVDERKDAFIALLGHELRNPLAAAMMASESLIGQLRAPRPPGVDKALSVLDHQLERLRTLVDELLDLARITRGKVQLDRQTIDIRTSIRSVAAAMRPLVESEGHTLELECHHAPLYADVDAARIEQMIGNLLDNAIRYTPAPGKLAIRAYRHDGGVRIDVEDNGRGLDADQTETLFMVFEQGGETPHAHQGLGLGLALVRSLAELHDGTATASSEGRGRGSTFTIWLPDADAPTAAPTSPNAGAPAQPATQRVLLVEDNEDLRDLLAIGLRHRGYEVREAASAADALAIQEDFDFGVFDIGLPDMSGRDLAQALMKRGRAPEHLVAISGFGTEADEARSVEAGFRAHLVKPISLRVLDELLQDLPSRVEAPEESQA